MNINVAIRELAETDILIIVTKFAAANWPKARSIFEQYLQEQQNRVRLALVAYANDEFAGYVTLSWRSKYASFNEHNIPEIMDLNVLPQFRNCGIGSRLLATAEAAASAKSDTVGIGVGLYGNFIDNSGAINGGYGAAQKLYVNRGYIPDGNGVTYNYQSITPGSSVLLDDDLVLWFIKKLK